MDVSIVAAAGTGLVTGVCVCAVPAWSRLRRRAAQLRELGGQLSAAYYRAEHDALTGLPNRAAFYVHAAQRMMHRGGPMAMVLVFVDIDDFKNINDTYGHDVGDAVLQVMARRIGDAVGPGGLVSRLGGDEFAALAPLAPRQTPAELGSSLCQIAEIPICAGNVVVHTTLSIGVAPVGDGATLKNLLHQADQAMYRAKRSHIGIAAVFGPEMEEDHAVPVSGVRPRRRTRDRGRAAAQYDLIELAARL